MIPEQFHTEVGVQEVRIILEERNQESRIFLNKKLLPKFHEKPMNLDEMKDLLYEYQNKAKYIQRQKFGLSRVLLVATKDEDLESTFENERKAVIEILTNEYLHTKTPHV